MCACYSKATGCETIWDQGNRGCYVHTEKVEKGNGVQRHSCWIAKKTCPTENFGELEKGFCVYGNNYDQNAGVVKLAGGDFKTPTKQYECLGMCACYKGATGCETIWDQSNRGCYVHTQHVQKGNGVQRHSCWIVRRNFLEMEIGEADSKEDVHLIERRNSLDENSVLE